LHLRWFSLSSRELRSVDFCLISFFISYSF
jgi:hypothetical protein